MPPDSQAPKCGEGRRGGTLCGTSKATTEITPGTGHSQGSPEDPRSPPRAPCCGTARSFLLLFAILGKFPWKREADGEGDGFEMLPATRLRLRAELLCRRWGHGGTGETFLGGHFCAPKPAVACVRDRGEWDATRLQSKPQGEACPCICSGGCNVLRYRGSAGPKNQEELSKESFCQSCSLRCASWRTPACPKMC